MKYNNVNSKSDEVSPTAILVSKNNVKIIMSITITTSQTNRHHN